MKLIVLIILLPYVFFAVEPTKGISSDDIKQLEHYMQLTEKLEKEGKPYVPEITNRFKAEEYAIYVYNRANTNGSRVTLNQARKLSDVSSFDIRLKTVVYTHGWKNTYNGENAQQIRDALLKAADVNVLIVDWDECANSHNYAISWGCTDDVGDFLGAFLNTALSAHQLWFTDVTLVGHSLGAHISGYAGKYTRRALPLIVALDAAAPLFFRGRPQSRLNATDAGFVQAIHTCAQFLGVSYNVGAADYWPNGGYRQAGCGTTMGMCSHSRAIEFYIESVTQNKFLARKCDCFDNFESGNCSENPTSRMAGLNIDTKASGDYYLETSEVSPYGTETA